MIQNHPKKTTPARNNKKAFPRLLFLLLIIILGVTVYSNSFHCSFQLDDIYNENPVYHSIDNPKALWEFNPRRFISNYTLALNYHFNKQDVYGYHLVNLIIHLGVSLTVFWLVILILSTPVMEKEKISRYKELAALFCGLLFVSHPIQTQAVTYIVQRMASLAALFYLVSLSCYLKARLIKDKNTMRLWFAGSAAAGIMGFLTKETVFTLPFALLLFEYSFFHPKINLRALITRKTLYYIFPPVLIVIAIAFLLSLDQKSLFGPVISARMQDPPLTSWIYLLTEFRVIATYLRLLIIPVHQNVDYDFPASRSFFEPATFLSFFLLAGILVFAFWLFSRKRLISVGIFWFFLTLSVESSIKPIQDVIFEHRLYLPMFGFCLAAVCVFHTFLWERSTKAAAILFLALISINSYLTYQRNTVWENEFTLWSDTVKKSPNKARPHNNLGIYYQLHGKIEEAKTEYLKTLNIEPKNIDALNDLGNILSEEGNTTEAKSLFQRAMSLDSKYSVTHDNLGNLLLKEGNIQEAKAQFNRAIEAEPDNIIGYINLGNACIIEGNFEEARKQFDRVLRIDPTNSTAYYNLGYLLFQQKKMEEARQQFLLAVHYDSGDVQSMNYIGNIFFEQGKIADAVQWYERVLRIDPQNEKARYNLESARSHLGK
jgi:protein O-mannosyl-transferase